MAIQVIHFDVFTSTPGKGNPAGIVLSADALEATTMQRIAEHTGFSTAFVSASVDADFRIRYFSPRTEVGLCGHATIAAAIALHARAAQVSRKSLSDFSLETNAGILPIEVAGTEQGELLVIMTQAPSELVAFNGDLDLLVRALGISRRDLHPDLPLMYGSTGRWTLVLPVRGLDVMQRMRPQPNMFAPALRDMPAASIHPFCLETVGPGVHMHARHFSAPGSGTVEDQ